MTYTFDNVRFILSVPLRDTHFDIQQEKQHGWNR